MPSRPRTPIWSWSAPFPVTRASLGRKIIRDLTADLLQAAVLYAFQAFRTRRDDDMAEGASVVTGRSVAPFLLVNAALFAGLTLAAAWWAYFALWLLPLATWFPMVTRLRNIAEHACVEGSSTDLFRAARTTRADVWERAFIAPYWVNFHAEHHPFMHVPCWKLPALHRAVRSRAQGARMEVANGMSSAAPRQREGEPHDLNWKPGRGLLGPPRPLLGAWRTEAEVNGHRMVCTRTFEAFGKGWVRLEAVWHMGERGDYREIALFGAGEDGVLGFFSFTNDGKRSVGRLADGSDVHPTPSP